MLYIFKFPDIGEGISEGKILEWFVKNGQEIKEGDPVVKMETDKVVADIPCPKSGVIKNIFGQIGETINVEDALVEIEIEDVDADDTEKTEEVPVEEEGYGVVGFIEDASTDAFLPPTGEGMQVTQVEEPILEKKKVLATPVARKMARDLGVDIGTVLGSGPAGRVMKADIQRAFDDKQSGVRTPVQPVSTQVQPAAADLSSNRFEIEDLSQIRKTIAARMVESKYTAPHATTFEEIEISKLIDIRNENKNRFSDQDIKLTYMPFILKAVALALTKHPKLNCRLDMKKNQTIYNKFYNIGVAIDTTEGLIVPVINDVDKKTVFELARELKDKADRARDRKLTLDELRDSTFSITNYGSIAGIFGAPIINYPNVAILGVGRILKKPVVRDDQIVPGNTLPLSLAVDHRIVDGGDAARFLKDLMDFLANPVAMLLE